MSLTTFISTVGGAIGAVGGVLGIIGWWRTKSEEDRIFNQTTYNKHIKYTFNQCFENNNFPGTDGVNMYYLWITIENMREFQRLENKFKGMSVRSCYNDAFLYGNAIPFDQLLGFYWYNQNFDEPSETNSNLYEEKKIHVQRFKPFFRDFYLSVFENLD